MLTRQPLSTFSRLVLRQSLPSRALSTSVSLARPDRNPNDQRDAQDNREAMNPEANEYAKSGTDNTVAKQDEAAFDTNNPDPQDAKKKAGEGNEVNPLDASPANVELSQKDGTSENKSN